MTCYTWLFSSAPAWLSINHQCVGLTPMEGSLGKGGVISKFGVKSINVQQVSGVLPILLVKLQTLAAMGIRAEM